MSRTGTTATPFGFVGAQQYQTDADSGLQLLGHRYYDPSVGRFISGDPAKAGTNWYAYCENGPLRGTDPQGLDISGHRLGEDEPYASGQDPGPWDGTYPTVGDAVKAMMKYIMPISINEGIEYSGVIRPRPSGGYFPSRPIHGTPTSCIDPFDPDAPAMWHTHPSGPNSSDDGDQQVADHDNRPVYAGNPYGDVWINRPRPGHRHDPRPGNRNRPRYGDGAAKTGIHWQ